MNTKLLVNKRIIKFVIIGIIGALVNLIAFYLMVMLTETKSSLWKNIFNVLSIEISIWFSFTLNRNWTWNDRVLLKKMKLMMQFFIFHLAVGLSVLLRIIMFPILDTIGIHYLFNSAIGIALGAVINYFTFDSIVFKTTHHKGY